MVTYILILINSFVNIRCATIPDFLVRVPPMQNCPDFGITKKFEFKHFTNRIDLQTGSDIP